jgi:hypothetical protein
MPFNPQSIDDLFRDKEPQSSPDTSRLQQHWKQMEKMLSPEAPVAETVRRSRIKQWAPWVLLVVAGAATVILLSRSSKTTTKPSSEPVVQNQTTAATENKTVVNNNPPQAPVAPAPVLIQKEEKRPSAKSVLQEPVAKKSESDDRYYIHLPKEPQMFYIDNSRDTLLTCREGTMIKIPAGVLVNKNGEDVTVPVTFIVQEYYKYEDVIVAGLRQSPGRKNDITAGMVKFDAYLDDEKVSVKPGRSIEIRMHPDLLKEIKTENNKTTDTQIEELNISKLGWINYERFYTDNRPRTTLRVTIPKDLDINKLISQVAFVSVQGILSGYIENNQVVFPNIPVGETAYFISIGQSGKKFLSCVEKLIVGEKQTITPRFTETSPEKFRQQLELFGSLPVKE